jgi:GTP-binding protein
MYGEGLADKPELLVMTKIDALDADQRKAGLKALKKAARAEPMMISGVSGEAVETVLRRLAEMIAPEQEDETDDYFPGDNA